MPELVRQRVRITGVVQGVGFRPFVWRRATQFGLRGWVENDPEGVTAEVEGPRAAVTSFLDGLAVSAPPLARITSIATIDLPPTKGSAEGFAILESRHGARRAAAIPPDVAPCDACLAEMADPRDRRFRHPFIACTDCGPRYTILESLPYDRATTTMRAFPMCPACAADYRDPAGRRFHAQPIACPSCGPTVWFAATGPASIAPSRQDAGHVGEAAIAAARALLCAGGIVAIKGVGGVHLACDATNGESVSRLRERKQRPRKPFAIMVPGLDAARRIAVVDEQEQRLLAGPERPIVLLRRAAGDEGLADEVAPGSGFLGVMLPSSPLHHLLCTGMRPLVMTSGNLAEEPIAIDNDEAVARLGLLADGFLLHDRDIHVACDDSVVRCVAGLPLPIRRSRGHAPLPIRLADEVPPLLAVGGDLKGVICVARGAEAVLSQHIGDVGSLTTLEALGRTARRLLDLLGIAPQMVVADLHPGYRSSQWAREFAAARGIPLVRVQHHEAHVASLLAEHGLSLATAEGTIGICFDGTGYGRDGTIHGGEVFVISGGRPVRAASLVPFPLPGGDAAIRHPWRTALAILRASGVDWDQRLPCVATATPEARRVLDRQCSRGFGCATTTSMGRLFDAVASLVGVRHDIDYEAEAALDLEALAADGEWSRRYTGEIVHEAGGPLRLDWRPLIRAIAADVLAGVPPSIIAAAFHEAVVRLMVDASVLVHGGERRGLVGLTGGVFQNAVLTANCLPAFHAAGFEILTHHSTPPNDGGLALGQAVLGPLQSRFV
jgi:hydrogenase maturation protein HypF